MSDVYKRQVLDNLNAVAPRCLLPVLIRRVQLSTVSNNPLAFRICRPVPQIMIDRRAVNEYLTLIGEKELPLNFFEIIDIEDRFPVERVNKLLNGKE